MKIEITDDYIDFTRCLAYKYWNKHSYLDKEECVSEAYVALCSACNLDMYDPEKGTELQYIYGAVINGLASYCKKHIAYASTCYDYEYDFSNIEKNSDFTKLETEEYLDELSELERKIVVMREAGFSDTEIGKELGYTRQRICQIRHDIQEKLL